MMAAMGVTHLARGQRVAGRGRFSLWVLAASFVLLSLATGPADASARPLLGWWWAGNQGAGSVSLPVPPDVPAGGMLIQGGAASTSGLDNASPSAFGAIVYRVTESQRASTLTLAVAPQSATTPHVPLQLCLLRRPSMTPDQGGSLRDAPAFSCATSVVGSPAGTGDRYVFLIGPFLRAGVLGVAVLPTSPTDRVVLSPLDSRSLALSQTSTAPVQALAGALGSSAAPSGGNGASAGLPVAPSLTSAATMPGLSQPSAASATGPAASVLPPSVLPPSTAAYQAVVRTPEKSHYASAFVLPLVLLVAVGFFGQAFTAVPDVEPLAIDARSGK